MENMKRELNEEEMVEVTGGDTSAGEAWLREYMAHYGLTDREKAIAGMKPEEKEIYQFHLKSPHEYDERYCILDMK